jgi:pilus assembly protein CpaC
MPGMINSRMMRTLALFVAVAALPLSAFAQVPPGVEPVRPGEQIVRLLGRDSKLTVIELQTRIVELASPIKTVDGHDPEILTIDAISMTRLRIKAEKPGVTSFTLTDKSDNVYNVEVFVDADVRALQAMLRRLFPGANIEVVGLNGDVLLRGWVIDPMEIPRIVEVAKKYAPNVLDQMNVGGVSQVQLQVKVMEVQRSKLREFGFNFFYADNNTDIRIVPANLTDPTFSASIIGSSSLFEAFVKAVETNSMAKVLADTALVTNSGRPATMIAGGEFPILVPQPGAGTTTFTVQYRPFGVRMEALPLVLGNGRLRLDVAPEVSERDASSAVSLNGTVVPGISLRRVNTQVEMRFGETLVLGGLILTREQETRTGIPVLKDIPVIGSVFSRRTSDVGETEVLIMVTPQMVAPIGPGQLPITGPGTNTETTTGHEFYLDGFVEVPRYNPLFDPIGAPAQMDLVTPYDCPPGGASSPSLPAVQEIAPPAVPSEASLGRRTKKSESSVQQASGIRAAATQRRSTTLGTMDPSRMSPQKEVPAGKSGASVKSNAGDDLRSSGSAGHSTGRKSSKLEMIEPAATSSSRAEGYSNR